MVRGRRATRLRRRAKVSAARLAERLSDSLAARPQRRFGAALALALLVNAGLAALLSFVPTEDLPEAPPGTPIEIVFLEPEPVAGEGAAARDAAPAAAPVPAPPTEAEAAPPPPASPAPAAPRGPAVDLPDTAATGTPGIVALDCNRVFADEARAVACAGGREVTGWQAEVQGDTDWTALAERIGRARRSLAPVPAINDPNAAARYGSAAAARAAANERAASPYDPVLIGVGPDVSPDTGDTSGAGAVAPPSVITSWGDRKAAEDAARIREEGRVRREMDRAE